MGTKQVIRLFDSQWVNVVNHDHGYEGYTVEDAVAKAVKLTEAYLAKNFKDGVWPTVEDAPNAQVNRDRLAAARYLGIRRRRIEMATDWIDVTVRTPEHREVVLAKYEGVYSGRIVTFWRDGGGNGHFGLPTEPDGKGSQPATHWAKWSDA